MYKPSTSFFDKSNNRVSLNLTQYVKGVYCEGVNEIGIACLKPLTKRNIEFSPAGKKLCYSCQNLMREVKTK